MKVLGVIPARGGSKRVPNKNLRLLKGKPLIQWTIEAASKSKLLTTFVVSTEDYEIGRVAAELGAYVVRRPDELAEDHTTSWEVCSHALEWMGDHDMVVLLHPTSPVRDPSHIDQCIERLSNSHVDVLVSVCELPRKKHWNVFNMAHYGIPGPTYISNASIYAFKRAALRNTPVIPRTPLLFEMDRAHSVDINEEADFALAEAFL